MSLKGKYLVIPAFLAGFACAALLATIPDSRAEDSCADTPLTVQNSVAIANNLTSSVDQYDVTYIIPDCLGSQGFTIISVSRLSSKTIQVSYGQ